MRMERILRPAATHGKRRTWRTVCLGAALLPAGMQVAIAQQDIAPDFTARPLDGKMTSGFGPRVHPITAKAVRHSGADIAAPRGTVVRAPAAGRVVSADAKGAYGNLLVIDHGGGFVTRYAQLDAFEVRPGDRVAVGEAIARVGATGRATGPHLHVEVIKDGVAVDPATILDLLD